MPRLLLTCLGLLALTSVVLAQATEPGGAEWPCFRGPRHDNVSPDKGLLKSWPDGGPKLVWKATGIGEGFSSVSLAGGKVFTMGSKDGKSYIHAIDAAKGGKPIWSTPIGKGGREVRNAGTRGTPTYSDGRLYGVSAYGDFACVDAKTGKLLWKKNFDADYSGGRVRWQFS